MFVPLDPITKKDVFFVDVSIKQATGRRWQTKLVDTWKVPQIDLFRQESVNGVS